MGNHVVEIETASVDLDYQEILENIEDTIAARVSDQITDEAWDAVEYQVSEAVSEHEQEYAHDDIGNSNDGVTSGVQELLLDYRRQVTPCGVGIAFEQAVWKAICRLDNPKCDDEWASAAKEYLLDRVSNDAAPSWSVRTVVREELATILLSFAKAVDAQLGAEVAVAPGD